MKVFSTTKDMGDAREGNKKGLEKRFNVVSSQPSVGKESACNAGNPGSIPGSGRSSGEGKGYSLQYSWASLVAQLVKNPPAIRETWVPSLVWEDPLEGGMATPLQYSCLENPIDRGAWQGTVHGVTRV